MLDNVHDHVASTHPSLCYHGCAVAFGMALHPRLRLWVTVASATLRGHEPFSGRAHALAREVFCLTNSNRVQQCAITRMSHSLVLSSVRAEYVHVSVAVNAFLLVVIA